MKIINNIWYSNYFYFLLILITSCSAPEMIQEIAPVPVIEEIAPLVIEVGRTFTNQTHYQSGETIHLQPFKVSNQTAKKAMIDTILIKISRVNGRETLLEKLIAQPYELSPNGQVEIPATTILSSNDKLDNNGYLVHVELKLSVIESGQVFRQSKNAYLTFFRIGGNANDFTYKIDFTNYDSLPVFTLKGGLSAEYTVQKSATALAGGISHSWNIPNPGMGPAPIKSTPDFLERSLQQTVDFYNQTFGETEVFETVIISTGIPSGAYLARAMNAPVLPIHFLVGAHTTKEIQTVLDYSEQLGTPAYATIGHDYSLSNNTAVAWIKLLSLPKEYQQFLIKHQVQNVIFHGALGLGGESAAKKLKDDKEHYGSGSIYVMHFAGNDSETYLKQTIRDFDKQQLGAMINISDWEAGIIDSQIDNMSQTIKAATAVTNIELVTTRDAIHLWNMGTYMMLHLLKKNNLPLKGISFNPYLIGHPVFETYRGYIPFLYWQGFAPQQHIDTRLTSIIQEAIHHYYPDNNINTLTCWVNSTNNFGGAAQGVNMANALQQNNFTDIINNNYTVGAVWNPTDGMNAAVEVRADNLVQSGVGQLKQWNQNLQFLTIADLKEIAAKWTDVLVISK